MTLALYGKSRKRQGTLVLGALAAIILAFVGAMAFGVPNAFADSTGLPCADDYAQRELRSSSERNNAYGSSYVSCT